MRAYIDVEIACPIAKIRAYIDAEIACGQVIGLIGPEPTEASGQQKATKPNPQNMSWTEKKFQAEEKHPK